MLLWKRLFIHHHSSIPTLSNNLGGFTKWSHGRQIGFLRCFFFFFLLMSSQLGQRVAPESTTSKSRREPKLRPPQSPCIFQTPFVIYWRRAEIARVFPGAVLCPGDRGRRGGDAVRTEGRGHGPVSLRDRGLLPAAVPAAHRQRHAASRVR